MKDIIIPEKKILSPFMKEIEDICQPLSYIKIVFFNYLKIYKDGSRIDLNNNHMDALDYYYYKSTDYKEQAIEWNPFKFKENILLWSAFPKDKFWSVMRNDFNIDNGITFIEKFDEYCELFHFASNRFNSEIMNYYLSNIASLKIFISYFKDRAAKIIAEAEKRKIIIKNYQIIDNQTYYLQDFENKKFIKNLKIEKFYIGNKNNYLTRREAECLYFIVRGKSAKLIGKYLGISYRTVEEYVCKLKTKFHASNIYELIDNSIAEGFLNLTSAILFNSKLNLEKPIINSEII